VRREMKLYVWTADNDFKGTVMVREDSTPNLFREPYFRFYDVDIDKIECYRIRSDNPYLQWLNRIRI